MQLIIVSFPTESVICVIGLLVLQCRRICPHTRKVMQRQRTVLLRQLGCCLRRRSDGSTRWAAAVAAAHTRGILNHLS